MYMESLRNAVEGQSQARALLMQRPEGLEGLGDLKGQ